MARHTIETAIDIDASAESVWNILVDFARYPDWNPFIRRIEGDAREGAKLAVRVQPVGKGGMTFRPRVLACQEGLELRWLGHLGIPGLFDGEHCFLVRHVTEGTCRLHHTEVFNGLLVPLLRKSLDDGTRQGFDAMNAAIKKRAEIMSRRAV